MYEFELDLTDSADKSPVGHEHFGTEFSTSGLATILLNIAGGAA
jgi:hypothetical protein